MSFLILAAPARAANECGPPPPPGQTLVCPAGEYPDGVFLSGFTGSSKVVLEPGFRARSSSVIFGVVNLDVIGPVDTLFESTDPDFEGAAALFVDTGGAVFVHIDDVRAVGPRRQSGVVVNGSNSVTLIADTVVAKGGRGVSVTDRPPPLLFPPLPPPIGTVVRVNSVITMGDDAPGIITFSQQGGNFIDSVVIATDGARSPGISAVGGFATIRSGSITTVGNDSPGMTVSVAGGQVNIVSANIATQGADSDGILARAGLGDIVVSAGSVSAAGSGSDAIDVATPGKSTVSIGGLVQSARGLALKAGGGPATVNVLAGGTLRGRVELTAGADRVDNAGTFDAIGSSLFGAGADLLDNRAAGIVRAVNGAAVFTGLESFANGGLVDLADGAADDSLALGGAYVGTGGARLRLDVDFAAGTADRLITGAATGSTQVEIAGGGFGSGILIVDAGAGTSPTAFALAAGSNSPYLRTELRFDAANNDFLVDRLLGTPVFETSRLAGLATALWYESADAVAAQLDTARDGRIGRGVALWLQAWSGENEGNGVQSFGGETFDVSFKQDFQGLQGGLDIRTGPVAVGFTGGIGRSDAAFLATGNPVDIQVNNLGAYVHGGSGLLFFNALAKFDWAELEIAPGAGLGASFDADLFGIQANAGVRFRSGSAFAEPSVGLSWVRSQVEAFASGPATVDPGNSESLRARAGVRAGARLPLGGGDLLPFASVDVYEELAGRNASDFTLGETLRLFDEPPGTRGQAAAGLSFAAARFEAFVRAEMDFSGGADAKAVRAGARLRF
jgi:hypothetical protein